jgi:hypothetical protein
MTGGRCWAGMMRIRFRTGIDAGRAGSTHEGARQQDCCLPRRTRRVRLCFSEAIPKYSSLAAFGLRGVQTDCSRRENG